MDRRRDGRGDGRGASGSSDKIDPRPSVFSRLGNKVAGQAGARNTSGAGGPPPQRDVKGSKGRQSQSPRKKGEGSRPSSKMSNRKDSPLLDSMEAWGDLDKVDQLTLEKKREMLQRELARQIDEDKNKLKRKRSKSSSSNSSSSSDSDSNNSDSSSSGPKKKKKDVKKKKKDGEIDKITKIKKLKAKLKLKKHEKKKKIAAKAKKIKTEISKDGKIDKKPEAKTGEREKSIGGTSSVPAEQSKPRVIKPGVQERDKFGFYIANPVTVPQTSKQPSRSKTRSPEKKERKRSMDREKKTKQDRESPPPARKGSSRERHRNSRDRSVSPKKQAEKSDRRKSPHKKSPQKKERSPLVKRERSRDRSPVQVKRERSRDRSPVGKRDRSRDRSPVVKRERSRDRSPGNRRSRERSPVSRRSRERSPVSRRSRDRSPLPQRNRSKDRSSAQRDRSPGSKKRVRDNSPGHRNKSSPTKEKRGGSRDRRDLNSDRGGGRDRDHRAKDEPRRDEDRRREDRGSHGPDDKRGVPAHKDDRDRREDHKRHDRDTDLRLGSGTRRDDRKGARDDDMGRRDNLDRKGGRDDDIGRRGDLHDRKGRDDDKGRGKERDGNNDDRRGRASSRGKSGKGNEERLSAQERLGARRSGREWEEEGDSRDIDSRRQSWARADSPRRLSGRGGRVKQRRNNDRRSDRGDRDNVNGWKREGRSTPRGEGRPTARGGKRKPSGGSTAGGGKDMYRPRSRQKSGNEKLSRDLRDNISAVDNDNSGDEISIKKEKDVDDVADTRRSNESLDTREKNAEDFSDFGESDDEILNQEEDDKTSNRSASRHSNSQNILIKDEKDMLGEIERDEDKMDDTEEKSPQIEKENDQLANALGVDWSQLMEQKEARSSVHTGVARKNWTPANIFRRIGLSKRFLGEEAYNELIEQVNKDLPEEEKVVLLDEVPGIHIQKTLAMQQDSAMCLAAACSQPLAMSAAMDMRMRRHLNGIHYPDHGPDPPPKHKMSTEVREQLFARMAARREARLAVPSV